MTVKDNTTNPLPKTMSGHPNTESLQHPGEHVLKAEKPDSPQCQTTSSKQSLESNAIQMEDHTVQGGMLTSQREHLRKGHLILMLPVAAIA